MNYGISVIDVEHITRCQYYIVKAIQGFYKYTRSDMIGLQSLVGQTGQRKLMCLRKILSLCGVTYISFPRISTLYVGKGLHRMHYYVDLLPRIICVT